ncbi:MAG: hypothetical protein Nk1A_6410 [Endomicrobiia bacterium]|nr:MAG: hypothetical protein Nk1A_6410 [Endomicrobiia bacterium]
MQRISETSQVAIKKGFLVNAGHGLDYDNIKQFCRISGVNEFNIDFLVIAKSIFTDLEMAVKNMKTLISEN